MTDNVAHVLLPRPCSSINNKKPRTSTQKTNPHPHVIVFFLLLAQITTSSSTSSSTPSSSSLTTPPLRSPLIIPITHHHDAGTAPPPPPLRSSVTPPLSLSKFDLVLLAETPPPPQPLPQTPQPDDLVPTPSPSNKNVAFALLISVPAPGSPSPRHPPLSLPLDPTVLCTTNTTSVTELAPAPPINAIFYACGNGVIGRLVVLTPPPPSHEEENDSNTSSVRYYNSTVLYTPNSPHNSSTTTIVDLRYWNGSLYWIDDDGETIRAMNVVKDTTRPTTTVIFSVLEWKKNTTTTDRIHGITIHRNGTLYFSSWSRRSSASIHGLDLVVRSPKRSNTFVLPTRDPYPIATHVHTPRHLTTSTHSLLFSTSPPGIYFTIERVSLEDETSTTGSPTKLRPATRAAHLHASSISTHCRTLYWTDVVDKHLRSVSLSPLSSDTSNSARRRQRQQQPPPSVIVGDTVLGQWADAKFTQVAAVSESHCPTPEAQQPERNPTLPPPVVSPRVTTTFTSSSSGSESTEETTATTQDSLLVSGSRGRSSPLRLPESVIRLCTAEEAENAGCIDAAAASAVSTSLVCLVFPPSPVPVCLTSLRRQPESLAAAATATATATSNTSTSNNSNNTQKSASPRRESSPAPATATPSPWPPQIIATISVLATLATIMTLVSVFMTVRVRTLSKKPVIRRRVVVSRRTSESGGGGGGLQPTSVCEMIDIENCCNMNVCETPCYERTLLQPLNPQQPPPQNNPPPSCSSTPRSSSSSPPPPQPLISVNSTNGPNWCSTGTLTCSKSSSSAEDKRYLLTF